MNVSTYSELSLFVVSESVQEICALSLYHYDGVGFPACHLLHLETSLAEYSS